MGLFSSAEEENTFQKMKPYIAPKDGNTHVLMVSSSFEWSGRNFTCNEKYTTKMDQIISGLQNSGYQIVDIKLSNAIDCLNTMIMYR